jgi:isochorismate pyruvate lyase
LVSQRSVDQEPDSLARVRAEIDVLDDEVVAILARRELLVRRAGNLKSDESDVRAPDRVEQVIAGVRRRAAAHGADADIVERIYRTMIDCNIDLELRQLESR